MKADGANLDSVLLHALRTASDPRPAVLAVQHAATASMDAGKGRYPVLSAALAAARRVGDDGLTAGCLRCIAKKAWGYVRPDGSDTGMLLREAELAVTLAGGDDGRRTDFLDGKVVTARHFARMHLPQVRAARTAVESVDDDVMELAEAAF